MKNVKSITTKKNSLGEYYFEIEVSEKEPSIEQPYHHQFEDGTSKYVPIKLIVLE